METRQLRLEPTNFVIKQSLGISKPNKQGYGLARKGLGNAAIEIGTNILCNKTNRIK